MSIARPWDTVGSKYSAELLFPLIKQVQRTPRRAYATGPGSQHKAPCCGDDRRHLRGLSDDCWHAFRHRQVGTPCDHRDQHGGDFAHIFAQIVSG